MNRVLLIFVAVFALAARSDGSLKCYMCNSVTTPACKEPSRDQSLTPIECVSTTINEWTRVMSRIDNLTQIAGLFDVDSPNYNTGVLPNAACVKTNMKVQDGMVVIRGCQTKKTDAVDPCGVLRSKLKTLTSSTRFSLEYCGLCDGDSCNGAFSFGQSSPKMFQLIISSFGVIMFQTIRQRFS